MSDEAPAAEIRERFDVNARRVDSFIEHYRVLKAGQSPRGRAAVEATDILRAATVFLHATVEDLLRSLLEWKLPRGSAEHLRELQFAPGTSNKRDSIRLFELASHRGKNVDHLVSEAVGAYLEKRSFNNLGEIKQALRMCGASTDDVTSILETRSCGKGLVSLMGRRHLIVHRMDRSEERGRGHHVARSISAKLVRGWRNDADVFANAVLDAIESE